MALFRKTVLLNAMRGQYLASRRFCARGPDPLDHATGIEKRELLAIAAGNKNPFDAYVMKRCEGTRDKPTCIPSAFDKRLIGCICNEDQQHISYTWLHADHMKRCACGFWFKLIYKAPV